MHYIFPKILLGLTALIGVLLLYASLFVYTDQQSRIQNILSDIINRTKVNQDKYSKNDLLVQALYEKFSKSVNALFGSKPVSLSSIGRIGLFSCASLFIFYGIFYDKLWPLFSTFIFLIGIMVLLSAVFLGRRRTSLPWYLFILILVGLTFWLSSEKLSALWITSLVTIILFSVNIACGTVSLYLLRKSLKVQAFRGRWYAILISYIISLLIVAIFYLLSTFVTFFVLTLITKRYVGDQGELLINLVYVFIANIGTFIGYVFIGTCFFILVFLTVFNRILWPIFRFPMRFFYEKEIIKSQKVIGGVGLVLLYSVFPQIKNWGVLHDIVETVIKK